MPVECNHSQIGIADRVQETAVDVELKMFVQKSATAASFEQSLKAFDFHRAPLDRRRSQCIRNHPLQPMSSRSPGAGQDAAAHLLLVAAKAEPLALDDAAVLFDQRGQIVGLEDRTPHAGIAISM